MMVIAYGTKTAFLMTLEQLYEELTLTVEVDKHGNRHWYNPEGKRHRVCGPAVEYKSGVNFWYQHGKLHREDGPAIEYGIDSREWYQQGVLHREDGPAVILSNGKREYWINGYRLSDCPK